MIIKNHRCWDCGKRINTNFQGEYKGLLCSFCRTKSKKKLFKNGNGNYENKDLNVIWCEWLGIDYIGKIWS